MEKINTLLEKYDNFRYAQLRSIQQLSDGSKIVTIVVQDDDGEDTDSVEIEFNNISNSKILIDSVLSFLDMGDGVSILKENNLYGFSVGNASAMLNIHHSPLFIIASEMEIREK